MMVIIRLYLLPILEQTETLIRDDKPCCRKWSDDNGVAQAARCQSWTYERLPAVENTDVEALRSPSVSFLSSITTVTSIPRCHNPTGLGVFLQAIVEGGLMVGGWQTLLGGIAGPRRCFSDETSFDSGDRGIRISAGMPNETPAYSGATLRHCRDLHSSPPSLVHAFNPLHLGS